MDSLFDIFDSVILFDTETTGVNPGQDEIIEIALLRAVKKNGVPVIEDESDLFIKLSHNKKLPAIITDLTGITEKKLLEEGVSKEAACAELVRMLDHRDSLLVAYNAQFDLCFLYYFLDNYGKAALLRNFKMLDVLTIYKDRKPYPHKLSDAVSMYSIPQQNAHLAIDDVRATYELLTAMGKEEDDLQHYVNLFGYNPKYGVSGRRISSVKYLPQKYDAIKKLYEF